MTTANAQSTAYQPVLCVDMDGTLLRTDTLWESVLCCLRHKPWLMLLLPFWLLRGKASLKHALASHAQLRADALPVNGPVLDFVRQRKDAGAAVWLVTGANHKLANSVAQHLKVFDGVIASNSHDNIVGKSKLHAIRQTLGSQGFDYLGDSPVDIDIWKEAGSACVVGPAKWVSRIRRDICPVVFATEARLFSLKAMIRLMRPHQWAKNILVFAPLLFAHRVFDVSALTRSLLAFLAFCAMASSIYIINDLWDIEADRLHPTKRGRPLASGEVSIPVGMAMSFVLAAAAVVVSLLVSPATMGMVLAYFALSTAYTLHLKTKLMMDVVVLAGLYTHRILSGGIASGIEVSPWLLAFSMFIFFSLAFLKRFSELLRYSDDALEKNRRGYQKADIDVVRIGGIGSSLMAVLVFALYVNGASKQNYDQPMLLWLECPLLLYCLLRLWFMGNRGLIQDDPMVFAMKDRTTVACEAVGLGLMVLAWIL